MKAWCVLFGAALLPGSALAAGFDCGKARTPVERAICDDPQLSALDDQMAQAYRDALGRLGEASAPILRAGQRDWLKSLPAPSPRNGNAAMRDAYGERVAALRDIPAYPPPDQPVEGDAVVPSPGLPGYDVTLRLLRACPADNGGDVDGVPAQLLVQAKGDAAPQVVNLPRILCGSAGVEIQDYNFDGHPDIAVSNDNALGYGSIGQTVLLYDAASRRFVFSAAFTEAVAAHSATLDAARKEIEAMNKSGCCYHHTTVYRVENGRPVAVRERIEDATGPRGMKVTERRLVNGRWVEKTFTE